MASVFNPTTLTVTITSAITINGQEINSSNQLIVPNITQYDKRILLVPTTPQTNILQFTTGVSAGTYIAANVKFICVTNLDDTNFVRLRVTKATAETFDIKLNPGQSFIMGNVSESASANAASFSAYVDATAIAAQADTAAVNIQTIVACIN